MELPGFSTALPYAVCAIVAAGLASWVSLRVSRRRQRDLQRQLAERELELLDLRADSRKLENLRALDASRESVLALAMERLTHANERIEAIEQRAAREQAQHLQDITRLKAAVQSSRKPTTPPESDRGDLAGFGPALAARLNAAGIHRMEELANLTDEEADALDRQLAVGGKGRHGAALQLRARKLLDQPSAS